MHTLSHISALVCNEQESSGSEYILRNVTFRIKYIYLRCVLIPISRWAVIKTDQLRFHSEIFLQHKSVIDLMYLAELKITFSTDENWGF